MPARIFKWCFTMYMQLRPPTVLRDSHCSYLLPSKTTAKETGLVETARKEDPVELGVGGSHPLSDQLQGEHMGLQASFCVVYHLLQSPLLLLHGPKIRIYICI